MPVSLEPISKKVTIIVGLTVVGFMAFGLMLSFYRNILFEQKLTEIEAENAIHAGKIETLYRDLDYYRSEQYKDTYAKENLGRLNPGEKVLIITSTQKDGAASPAGLTTEETKEARLTELLKQMPVIEHWQLYLFQKEKIEELKRSL
jgi:hypothetical protein